MPLLLWFNMAMDPDDLWPAFLAGWVQSIAARSGSVHVIMMRAGRLGTGRGRIYTLTFKATDTSGNSAISVATVTVPHDQGRGNSPRGRRRRT